MNYVPLRDFVPFIERSKKEFWEMVLEQEPSVTHGLGAHSWRHEKYKRNNDITVDCCIRIEIHRTYLREI